MVPVLFSQSPKRISYDTKGLRFPVFKPVFLSFSHLIKESVENCKNAKEVPFPNSGLIGACRYIYED